MSLMTVLAMFHMYPSERIGYVVSVTGSSLEAVKSTDLTWFSILGDAANQVGEILSSPYLIYAPLIGLLATMVGAGLISRGIRGRSVS